MLILKENAANSVPTPPVGKDTFFIDDSGVPSIKNSGGNVTTFPTVNASNAQVVFMNGTSLAGEAALTYDFNNNILTVTGNLAATNVKTDNLLYANGAPWDLQLPGGANSQVQFNDSDSFGGSANFVFNKTTGNANVGNIGATNGVFTNVSGNGAALTAITGANVTGEVTFAATANSVAGANVSGQVANALVAGTVYTAAQPNITSVGTLSSLTVTGNTVSGNVYANSGTIGANVITGNTVGGTLTTAAQPNITSVGTLSSLSVTGNASAGNVNAGNLLLANFVTGTLTTNVQPNITSVGSLTSLTVSGNANVGNIGGTTGVFTNVSGTLTTAAQPNITSVGTLSSLSVTGNASAGNVSVTGAFYGNAAGLTNIPGGNITGNITGNISNATHAVTANTVVDASQPNITSVGTLSSVAVTGNANVGNLNSAGKVVASTFESNVANGTAPFSVNSVTKVANLNADLLDGYSTAVAATANTVVIRDGDGSFSANIITGTLSGAATTAGTVTTNAQPNITSVGTLTSLAVTGNASAGNIDAGNLLLANFVTGTLTTAAQPNITSVGSLTSLSVLGNANVGNIGGNNGVFTTVAGTLSTAAQPNITSVGTLSSLAVTGNATAGNVYANSGTIGASLLTGTLTTNAQPNITSVGTLTSLTVSGNISAGNITGGALANGNSNVNIPAAAGNVNISVNGTANVAVVTATGVNVAGTLNATGNANVGNIGATNGVFTNVSGNGSALSSITGANVTGQVGNALVSGTVYTAAQPNITSVGTLTGLGVNGNITAANITANTGVFTGNGSGLSAIAGGNVTGQVANALVAGTVYTNAQPNITSVGTLSSLAVTGNVTAANFVGNLANGNSDISIPAANGNINFDVGGTANLLVVTSTGANIAGTLNATGNANVGNIGATTAVITTGNITTINSELLQNGNSNISITANGNINISATGTPNELVITSTGVNVAGTLNATGNANVGNLGTAQVLASANVTAPQLISNVSTGTAPLVVTSTTVVANLRAATSNVANTVADAAQPNITSVGTLTSLAVTGNATAGNVYANSGTIGASLLTGTLTTAAQPNVTSLGTLTSVGITGNATAGNVYANSGTIGASLLTGTLTTNAQPNITSVGTLSSLSVTANVAAGNLTTTGVLSVTGTGVSSIAGNLDMTSNNIINLATPVNATDAATKQYVDDVAQGLNIHDSCQAATPDTLANITGGTITYNNGTAGVGATLVTTGTFNLIDGVNVQTAGTRILVKNEANAVHNGIYTYTNTTAITRAADFNSVPEVEAGDFTFITGGTLYDNTGWVQTESPTGIGTAGNNISFTQFSGAGTYNAGTGLTLTGSTFSVNVAQPTITSVGTLTGLSVNGNITAANITANTGVFTGNGSGLSAIAGGNVTGQVGNALVAGTVYTAAQPNITSVGTLSSVAVTGNANVGNLNAATAVIASTLTSNVATGTAPLTVSSTTKVANLNADLLDGFSTDTAATANTVVVRDANASFSANIVTATLSGAATTAGTVTTAAQPNITSVGTLTGLGVNGTVTAVNITANTGVFTGNGSGLSQLAGGNVTGQVGNALVAGTVYTAAQPNITSVGTLSSVAVTGNANVGNLNAATAVVASTLTSNVATGTAPLTVTSTTRVANLNVAYANVADNINVTTQSSGNAYLIFANALTGNVAETANASFVANTSNGALYATTFIGAVSGNGAALTDLNASNISSGTLAQARLANAAVTLGSTALTLGATVTTVAGLSSVTSSQFFASANITTPQFISNVATGTAPFVVSSTTQVANLNVATSGTAGTVTTAAQPNITSLGTLSSLGVNGTVTAVAFTANTGVFTGNGSGLSAIAGGNVTGQVANALVAGTVYTAAQPNITSVGTLSSLTVSGNLACGAFFDASVNAAVSAAGTAQGNATVIASEINVVSTVASGAGVALPTGLAGIRVTLINTSANALLVYPASGGAINSLATNASYSLPASGRLEFVCVSATQWYTLNATYG